MPIPTFVKPGPNLPLINYSVPKDLDVREIPSTIYRAIIRCYAIELLPTTILSVNKFNHLIHSTRLPSLAIGANFKLENHPLRYDPNCSLTIHAQEKITTTDCLYVPVFEITDGWWNTRFYGERSPLTQDEFVYYQSKILKAFMRLITLGFNTKHHSLLEKRPGWMKFPDLTKGFTKPLPGAIVEVEDVHGWVVRQLDKDTVAVEMEDLTESVFHITELKVLG